MADSTLTTCVFLFLTTLANMIEANPIGNARTLYSELVNATNRLRTLEERLLNEFKSDRLPHVSEVAPVDVPNLRLSEDMTLAFRMQASVSQLLTTHRDYFMNYKIIMNCVLEDERNTTNPRNFISNINEISLFTSITITKLENVMDHLGISVTSGENSEQDAPYFTPTWERNVYRRHVRDCYVLEQLQEQLIKAENDFTRLRNNAS